MKSLVFWLAILMLPLGAKALDAKSLRDCALSPDSVLIDYQNNQAFIFKGADLFRIQLPVKGGLVSLSPAAFPNEKQNCFDFTRGGRVKFEELSAPEMKQCQEPQKQIAFSLITKEELSIAAELVLGDYFQLSEEIDSALFAPGPAKKVWGRENLADLIEKFRPCERLTELSEDARATQTDIRDRIKQLKVQSHPKLEGSRMVFGSPQDPIETPTKSIR